MPFLVLTTARHESLFLPGTTRSSSILNVYISPQKLCTSIMLQLAFCFLVGRSCSCSGVTVRIEAVRKADEEMDIRRVPNVFHCACAAAASAPF